ncbi:MAG: prolyl oligopeptidase family serine peptidase, partial [Planctomycetaceae bacterium]|nr:prolyl oligopeptidase family serine peptidase [Planctomycetaceae bacterium]
MKLQPVAVRTEECSVGRSAIMLTAAFLLAIASSAGAETSPKLERISTPDGVEFGLWNRNSDEAAPVLFVLAGTIESTLDKVSFRQCGNELARHGWVCVSIDLPCHGTRAGDGEPAGLSGWSHLAAKQIDFVAESNTRLSRVLDHLIEAGIADPERIAACGTSRGGFLAIHFAAYDRRVKCAAGFAPVTDLAALSEFQAIADSPFVAALCLENQADALAGRPVWIVIGDQ